MLDESRPAFLLVCFTFRRRGKLRRDNAIKPTGGGWDFGGSKGVCVSLRTFFLLNVGCWGILGIYIAPHANSLRNSGCYKDINTPVYRTVARVRSYRGCTAYTVDQRRYTYVSGGDCVRENARQSGN